MTGIVGAAGGIGGFLLPSLLGAIKESMGSFAIGFLAFAVLCFGCAAAVGMLTRGWVGMVERTTS